MKQNKKPSFFSEAKEFARRRPRVFAVYIVLRLIVIAVLIRAILLEQYESAMLCLLVLVLFLLPSFFEKKLKIELPDTLQIIILVFIFAAEILGELGCYFIQYPHWDTMLHTTSGFLCAAFGFSLVNLLNGSNKVNLNLSPLYMALAAFCFSMTIGVLWEFIEFSADRLFLLDMQKDTVISTISSVSLDPTNSNIPIVISNITDVTVNGESLGLGGYLDIGLYDTMEDLFVNFIGAIVFSVFGYFYVKHRGKGRLVDSLVPKIADDEAEE